MAGSVGSNPRSGWRPRSAKVFRRMWISPVRRHPLRGLERISAWLRPRVRGLTRGFMPSPASRVRPYGPRHRATTGSRTHPWLYAVTRSAGSSLRTPPSRNHGFADSPVALCRHPLRGFEPTDPAIAQPRVRGLTRGFMPSPAPRVTFSQSGFIAKSWRRPRACYLVVVNSKWYIESVVWLD